MYSMDEMIGWSLIYSETEQIGKIEILKYNSEKLFKIFKKTQELNINIFLAPIEIKREIFKIFSKDEGMKKLEKFLCSKRNIEVLYEKIEKEKEIIKKNRIEYITYNSPDYPKELKRFKQPPFVIYYNGDFICKNSRNMITLVGTREPKDLELKEFVLDLIDYIKEKKFLLISGLAKGCDELAHKLSLEKGIKNIAIIGQGLATEIYPKENKELAMKIVGNGGVILSEIPPSFDPKGIYFLQRNRLQSYFSQKIVVLETGKKGGTVTTMKFAMKEKRKVYMKDSFYNREILTIRNLNKIKFIKNSRDLDRYESAIERKNLKLF